MENSGAVGTGTDNTGAAQGQQAATEATNAATTGAATPGDGGQAPSTGAQSGAPEGSPFDEIVNPGGAPQGAAQEPNAVQEALNETPGGDAPADKPEVRAPEKYELKAPEGIDLNAGEMKSFVETLAREADLSNEAAQKIVDLTGRLKNEFVTRQENLAKEQVASWRNDLVNDVNLGGSPENLKRSVDLADRGLKMAGNKELTKLLKDTGLIMNKHVIGFLKTIGTQLSEDQVKRGTYTVPKTTAQKHFPNTQY